jgi:hypothetical protein
MTAQISAEFKDKELRKFLSDLNSNLKKLSIGKFSQVMNAFGVIIYADVIRHFQDTMGPKGKWGSWSKLYRDRQAKLGYREPNNVLRNTGHLFQSFKPSNYKKESEGLLWFNNANTRSGFPYAYFHDEGSKKPRSFMWLSRAAFDNLAMAALDALLKESE